MYVRYLRKNISIFLVTFLDKFCYGFTTTRNNANNWPSEIAYVFIQYKKTLISIGRLHTILRQVTKRYLPYHVPCIIIWIYGLSWRALRIMHAKQSRLSTFAFLIRISCILCHLFYCCVELSNYKRYTYI